MLFDSLEVSFKDTPNATLINDLYQGRMVRSPSARNQLAASALLRESSPMPSLGFTCPVTELAGGLS